MTLEFPLQTFHFRSALAFFSEPAICKNNSGRSPLILKTYTLNFEIVTGVLEIVIRKNSGELCHSRKNFSIQEQLHFKDKARSFEFDRVRVRLKNGGVDEKLPLQPFAALLKARNI